MWSHLLLRSGLVLLVFGLSTANLDAQTIIYDYPGALPGYTSVRAAGDVNGDGVPDFLVGLPAGGDYCNNSFGGTVQVYSGKDGTILHTFTESMLNSSFGFSVSGAGDVNNDGYADIIVGDPVWTTTSQCGQGRAIVYSGLDGAVLYTLTGTGGLPNGIEFFGYSVSGAGDVNNDGYADVIVGSVYGLNYNNESAGYARVFSGFDGSVLFTLYGNAVGDRFGYSVAGVGDVNHDGFPDLMVGTPSSSYAGACGSARVYSGKDGLILYFFNGSPGCLGWSVDAAGDVNADGIPDMLVDDGAGARVYSGADGSLLFNFPAGGTPGHRIGGAGDVNNDGHADIIVATQQGARVYSGANGSVLYDYSVEASDSGVSVGSVGDLNHDGNADVILGLPNMSDIRVYLSHCPPPATYCTAKLNSLGCLPSISSIGVLSLTLGSDDFNATATSIRNNKTGFLFWGHNPASVPFGGGIRCVGSPITRTAPQDSGGNTGTTDCSGTYSFHFSRSYVSAHAVVPGSTLYAQYWSRDPGYSPPNNMGLTNGVSFTVCP